MIQKRAPVRPLDQIGEKPSLFLVGSLFATVFAAFLFLHATQPILDPDFWWHLKTGKMMVEQKGLLYADPFTFHAGTEATSRESMILKGYWLWQTIAYGLYALLGFNGIFLLNLLVIGAIAGTMTFRMYRSQVALWLSAPLLTGTFILLRSYPPERPQLVSFLLVTLLAGVLTQLRKSGKVSWQIPALMCLWANLHGGFVVGVIMLGCFAAGVTLQYRDNPPERKRLLTWTLAGAIASLANPNGGLAFIELFNFVGKPLQTNIIEYRSTWAEFSEGSKTVIVLWAAILLYGAGTLLRRRFDWPEVLVAVALGILSVKHMRSVAFFPLAMLPAIGLTWQELFRDRRWRLPAWFQLLTIAVAALPLLWLVANQWKERRFDQKVLAIYPEAGIDFLLESGMQGRMFNSYEYGGYLVWRLAPGMKVFIDGRGLNEQIFSDYQKISLASLTSINGRKEYQALLERYQVDYVFQPIYDGYGNVQPLMKALLSDPWWVPIYLDTQVYILAKDSVQTRAAIDAHAIDKEDFKNRLLLIYSYLHRAQPEQTAYRVARAGLLIYLGSYQEARAEIEAIEQESPADQALPALRKDLHLLAGRLRR